MVSLWVVRARDVVDTGSMSAWTACLSAEERAQRSRGLDERTRIDALVSRALLRRVLSRLEPVAPTDWRFGASAHGRPLVLGPRRAPSFNISHSAGTIACAVGDAPELGLDVEDTRRKLDLDAVARVSFSPRELAGFDALTGAARRARFFALWTLKEAYLKARGAGLTLPLDGFTISGLDEGAPSIGFEPWFDDSPERWRLTAGQVDADITAAIAARQDLPLTFRLHRVTPTAWLDTKHS